jgi:hypothetical protein
MSFFKNSAGFGRPLFLFLCSLLLVFNACENQIMIKLLEPFTTQEGKGNEPPATGEVVTGDTLQERIDNIKESAKSGVTYKVTLDDLELSGEGATLEPSDLSYPGKNNITIQLSGTGNQTVLLGSTMGSLFTIGNGVTLELDNVTLQGAEGNKAALVKVNGGRLIMNKGAKITGNTNIDNGFGGGVYVASGAFIMQGDSEISDNRVTNGSGGGVYVDKNGILTLIEGAKITHNTANGPGGGVINDGTLFTMTGGTISGNTATGAAGGVYNREGCAFTMTNGTISGNNAVDESGGGVFNSGTFTMTGGEITGGNNAKYGGGVANDGTFTMSGEAVISGNAASTFGGGVVNCDTFEMNGGTISGNNASESGGGVYNQEGCTFTMTGGEITGGNNAKYGGGVANDGTFTMSGEAVISGNTASTFGGGVYVPGGTVDDEGGVHKNGTFNMSDGTITGNNAQSGGGVYVGFGEKRNGKEAYGGEFTMSDGTISGNTANGTGERAGGGGVYNNGTFTMSGGKIGDGNNAAQSGGGVYVLGTIVDTSSSSATEPVVHPNGTFTMSDGTISGNTAGAGGGVYIGAGYWEYQAQDSLSYKGGEFKMKGGQISENNAESGGGVYVGGSTSSSDMYGIFIVGGTAKVSSNHNTTNNLSNVWLDETFITLGDNSSNDVPIPNLNVMRIYVGKRGYGDTKTIVLSGASAAMTGCFFADDQGYTVSWSNVGGGRLELVQEP